MFDQRSRRCVTAGVCEQTTRAFERRGTVRIERQCTIELLACSRPVAAPHVNQSQRRVRLGNFIVRCQRALGARLRELRERRLILAAEAEIRDRQRGTRARETRLMACKHLQSLDDARALRRAGTREALAAGTEQLERVGEIRVVCIRVVGTDQRDPVRGAGRLRIEKLRQSLRERADHGEAILVRQLQLLLALDDAIGRDERDSGLARICIERDTQCECAAGGVDRGDSHPAAVQQVAQLVVEPGGFGAPAAPMPLRCAAASSCERPRAPEAAAAGLAAATA